MTTSRTRRRPSDVASDIIKSLFGRVPFRRSDDTKRSLSTGDLVIDEEYSVIDFTQAPTTSKMAANFDDCDRVPMNFGSGAPKLIPQYRASARKMMTSGSSENVSGASPADLHRAQTWFYHNVDSQKAERILMDGGFTQGSFLVHCFGNVYELSFVHEGQIQHIRILCCSKGDETRWRIGLEKSFKNLRDLVQHYTSHKGFILPTKLKNGIARPLRVPHERQRTRA